MMSVVSGQRSTLNPNAPLFVPAAYRQVEDFSPEWWELVKNSTWFRDYWLNEHPDGNFDGSAGNEDEDVVNLLPENFDLGADEEIPNLEAQFEELVMLAEAEEKTESKIADPTKESKHLNGLKMDVKALLKDMNAPKSPKERSPRSQAGPSKFQMKPLYSVSPKCTLQRINQPR